MRTIAAAVFVGVLYVALTVASIAVFDGPSVASDHVTSRTHDGG
ncbi:MAG: hypothetical protein AB7W59_16830 [Acidimicrobiia bacterium]